jgi:enoyl-CoA hydratase
MESSHPGEGVLVEERHGEILVLTLNRPRSRNALNRELIGALGAAIEGYARDLSAAVLVLTGVDPAFCAGLDLREFSQPGAPAMGASEVIHALAELPKPVIGAVNGPAVTGGLELALACDFLIASERAAFADTHARVGVLPGGGMTARLPQAVGQRLARQMSFTGDYLPADRALAAGLVNEVVEHGHLLDRALEVAGAVAGCRGDVVSALKSVYVRGAGGTLADALAIEAEAVAARRAAGHQYAHDPAKVMARGRTQLGATTDASPTADHGAADNGAGR